MTGTVRELRKTEHDKSERQQVVENRLMTVKNRSSPRRIVCIDEHSSEVQRIECTVQNNVQQTADFN